MLQGWGGWRWQEVCWGVTEAPNLLLTRHFHQKTHHLKKKKKKGPPVIVKISINGKELTRSRGYQIGQT